MRIILQHFFLIFFLHCFVYTNAQNNITTKLDEINKLESNENKIKQYKKLLQQQDTLNYSEELGVLYYNLGIVYKKSKNFKKALVPFKKATFIFKKHRHTLFEQFNKSRIELAKCYGKTGNIDIESKILNAVLNDSIKDKKTIYAYKKMANIKKHKGDFHAAFQYLNTLLSNKKLIDTKTEEIKVRLMFIEIYAKIHVATSNLTNHNKDIEVVKIHQKIIEDEIGNWKIKKYKLYMMYNNLGVIYDSYNDYDNALKLYNKAYHYYLQKKDSLNFLKGALNIGILNSKLKKHKIAKIFYQKVIRESTDKELIADTYNDMGYYLDGISSEKKIFYFQKAINTILSKQVKLKIPFVLPTISEIKSAYLTEEMLTYLIDLAYQYVTTYKEKKEKHYLIKAKETLYLIDELVSLIRYESNNELSKLFWIKRGVNTYILAVEVCYLLNKPKEAFYFMEKNKALLLQENIKELQAKLALNIPKKIVEREYALHYKQIELSKSLQSNPNDKKIRTLYAKEIKIYTAFMDSIKQKYPNYVKVKKEIKTVSLDKMIKKYTSEKRCFVEYILNDEEGYGLFCNSKEKILFKIENIHQLQIDLKQLRGSLTKPILNKNKIKSYRNIGYTTFKKLFAFDNAFAKITNKKMLVIPDYTLQNFPFEALPTNLENDLTQSYLVQNTEISYLQSFSVFEQIIKKKNTPKSKILGIAPTQFLIDKLPELTTSEKSIEKIKQYKSSKVLTKEQGTKSNFLENSNDYEIIHLNTHAGLDSITKEPWIAFRKQKLTLNEMFGIENQANLVILDACKTNDGDLAIGEGIINLSRGFFYNGTQSVLASLWNVNEKSSTSILDTFYKNLETGKTKSRALQLAKKHYLKTHQSIEILPYYWATFTLTGDTGAITLSKNNFYLKFAIASIVLLLLFLFIYLKNKKSLPK